MFRTCFNAQKVVRCLWFTQLSVVLKRTPFPCRSLCSSFTLFTNLFSHVNSLPLLPVPLTLRPPTSRAQSTFPSTPEEASNENPLSFDTAGFSLLRAPFCARWVAWCCWSKLHYIVFRREFLPCRYLCNHTSSSITSVLQEAFFSRPRNPLFLL